MARLKWFRGAPAGKVRVADVLERVRAFAPSDYRRWKSLGEIFGANESEVLASAGELLRSHRLADKILGAQLLDAYLGVLSPADVDLTVEQFTPDLREASSPHTDPVLIEATLGLHMLAEPDDLALLRELAGHPAAPVRAAAIRLLIGETLEHSDPVGGQPTDMSSDQQVVSDLLAHDPDPAVREEAATALAYRYLVMAARLAMRPKTSAEADMDFQLLWNHRADPLPAVRAASLRVGLDVDKERPEAVRRLVAELAEPMADWNFVVNLPPIRALLEPEEAADLLPPLLRLQEGDWPAVTGRTDRYPDVAERAQMLHNAVESTRDRLRVENSRRRSSRRARS